MLQIQLLSSLLILITLQLCPFSNQNFETTLNMDTGKPEFPQDFEERWLIMQQGIDKLINILEGVPDLKFSSEEYMLFYTIIYDFCYLNSPTICLEIYDRYKETYKEYTTSKVLPSLREKKDEDLLRDFVKRWSNHKEMVRWLSKFFYYLNRRFLPRAELPSTEEAGFMSFYDLVYKEMNTQIRDTVISMIYQDREGKKIDESLIKNVLEIYLEMGRGSMKHYNEDFEAAMLEDTTAFYSQKAANWIMVDSYADYMLKANGCLKQEMERAANYLHSSSQKKLLEIVERELLSVYASKLQAMSSST